MYQIGLKQTKIFSSNFTLSKAIETNGGSSKVVRQNTYKNFAITDEMQSKFDSIKDKLAIINSFIDKTNTEFFITSNAENIINQTNKTYEAISNYAYKFLLTQTRLKDYLNLVELEINKSEDGNFEFALNYDGVIAKFNQINLLNPQKTFVDLAEFKDLYKDKSTITSLMKTLTEFALQAKDKGEFGNYLKLLSDETIKNLSTQHGSENDDILIGTGILNGIDTLYGNGGFKFKPKHNSKCGCRVKKFKKFNKFYLFKIYKDKFRVSNTKSRHTADHIFTFKFLFIFNNNDHFNKNNISIFSA